MKALSAGEDRDFFHRLLLVAEIDDAAALVHELE
jgi:hypothetical protein